MCSQKCPQNSKAWQTFYVFHLVYNRITFKLKSDFIIDTPSPPVFVITMIGPGFGLLPWLHMWCIVFRNNQDDPQNIMKNHYFWLVFYCPSYTHGSKFLFHLWPLEGPYLKENIVGKKKVFTLKIMYHHNANLREIPVISGAPFFDNTAPSVGTTFVVEVFVPPACAPAVQCVQ